MSGGFFRGTTIEQDRRFGDARTKLLREQTFSSALKRPVDLSKVNMEVIKPWLSSKIHTLLQIDDEVLYEYIVNMLEESDAPDPKAMQVSLTGFLEDKTQEFMESLWLVLLEAQESPAGIPESFVRRKMEELRERREEKEKLRGNIRAAEQRGGGTAGGAGSGGGGGAERRTRTGRRSRWDAPADAARDGGRSDRGRGRDGSRDRDRERNRSRDRNRSRERDSRRRRSRSPGERSYRGRRRDDGYRRRSSRSPSPH
ncbi:hypothetical protein LPJ53_001340 [Coemansia erecta]|uniref:PWI domain-containing protein n=1 Tax=Coemansia erecta TaxID=147472 RepID=A0A9W7Y5L9_9FUNG|nr:hypothetical protein LPJ53_001340 [Coemansia erecta]